MAPGWGRGRSAPRRGVGDGSRPLSVEVTLLGTGTSTGVPIIGCTCPVCTSVDPRNRRLRPGAKLAFDGRVVLIDTPTDLRQQALRWGLPRLDAVLFTHAHADHVFGLDEVRVFNFRQRTAIPLYGAPETLAALRRVFAYAFEPGQEGGGKPRLELLPVHGPVELFGRRFVPVPVLHGRLPVLGWRVGRFAYVTDVSAIPEESYTALDGVDTLVLGALRYTPHSTHFNVEEAIAAAERIGARQTFLTHLAHEVDHGQPRFPLPTGVAFGYDGLTFTVE